MPQAVEDFLEVDEETKQFLGKGKHIPAGWEGTINHRKIIGTHWFYMVLWLQGQFGFCGFFGIQT
jgi:hypothetical protein